MDHSSSTRQAFFWGQHSGHWCDVIEERSCVEQTQLRILCPCLNGANVNWRPGAAHSGAKLIYEKKNDQKQRNCDGGWYVDIWGPRWSHAKSGFLSKEDAQLFEWHGANNQHKLATRLFFLDVNNSTCWASATNNPGLKSSTLQVSNFPSCFYVDV